MVKANFDNFNKKNFIEHWKNEGFPYKNEIGDNAENIVSWVKKYDPSVKSKYTKWIIQRYSDSNINKMEDIPSRIFSALKKYQYLTNKKILNEEHKDINTIKNIEDVIDQYKIDSFSSKRGEEKELLENNEAKNIFNDDEYKVTIPLTINASKFYGRNTRWCTAAEDNNMFHSYADEDPLFIILHKKSNSRWQFHFNSLSFMDEKDNSIELKEFFTAHPKMISVFFEETDEGYYIDTDKFK
jgi:hypothetical protein